VNGFVDLFVDDLEFGGELFVGPRSADSPMVAGDAGGGVAQLLNDTEHRPRPLLPVKQLQNVY